MLVPKALESNEVPSAAGIYVTWKNRSSFSFVGHTKEKRLNWTSEYMYMRHDFKSVLFSRDGLCKGWVAN